MDIVDQRLSRLIGLPCWSVQCDPWLGLELHFGPPTLQIREPHATTSTSAALQRSAAYRSVTVRGTWWFWAHSGLWHLRLADDATTYSKFTPSARKRTRALHLLDGQKLLACGVDPKDGRTELLFDCGAALRLWESRWRDSKIWRLYEEGGPTLTVRADGSYSNTPPMRADRWQAR